jgi:hypothetical protein
VGKLHIELLGVLYRPAVDGLGCTTNSIICIYILMYTDIDILGGSSH